MDSNRIWYANVSNKCACEADESNFCVERQQRRALMKIIPHSIVLSKLRSWNKLAPRDSHADQTKEAWMRFTCVKETFLRTLFDKIVGLRIFLAVLYFSIFIYIKVSVQSTLNIYKKTFGTFLSQIIIKRLFHYYVMIIICYFIWIDYIT